jgi:hypothetical protein
MPASLLWLSCRSALVAPRARLAPRRVLDGFAPPPPSLLASWADRRSRPARGGLRSAGVPAAAAFRCVVPGARPGSVAAREG